MEDQTDLSQFRSPEKYIKKLRPLGRKGGKKGKCGLRKLSEIQKLTWVSCGDGVEGREEYEEEPYGKHKCGSRESATFSLLCQDETVV
jgi:hypothetical protein